ncbi:MAG: hypothetical protein V2A56_01970 [bacterium]
MNKTYEWSRHLFPAFLAIVLTQTIPMSTDAAPRFEVGSSFDSTEVKALGLFPGEKVEFLHLVRDPTSLKWNFLLIQHSPSDIDTLRIHQSLVPILSDLIAQREQGALEGIPCELELKQMEGITGRFVKWDGWTVKMSTPYGDLDIPAVEVTRATTMMARKGDGERIQREDPNTTRLFFAPTGRSLKKGDGYFAVYEAVFPDINYSIGNNVTIGGGLFPFSNADFFLAWLTPKIGLIETPTKAFAVGTLSFFANTDSSSSNVNLIYGVGTWGKPDAAVTLGFGYGLENGKFSDRPIVVVGGEYRIGLNTKLISENWLPPNLDDTSGLNSVMFSLGIRWFGRRMAADFALLRNSEMNFLGVPWVDFVINF